MSEQMTPMVMAKIKTVLAQPNGLTTRVVGFPFNGTYQEVGHEILRNWKSEFKKLTQCDKSGRAFGRIIEINDKQYVCTDDQWKTIEDLVAPIHLRTMEMAMQSKSMGK